jgi:hypothetical protein
MGGKFGSNEVFTIVEEKRVENPYQSNATDYGNNGNEAKTATDLFNIRRIFQAVLNPTTTTSTNASKPIARFYVEMPQSPTTPTNNQQDELVVNLNDCNLELNVLTMPS